MQVQKEINISSPMINALPRTPPSGMVGKHCHFIKSPQVFQPELEPAGFRKPPRTETAWPIWLICSNS